MISWKKELLMFYFNSLDGRYSLVPPPRLPSCGVVVVNTVVNPSVEQAIEFITDHHTSKAEKTLLLILGDCMVGYRGRARSFLDWGERIIMIKQDGTLLVHQPVMREPAHAHDVDSAER